MRLKIWKDELFPGFLVVVLAVFILPLIGGDSVVTTGSKELLSVEVTMLKDGGARVNPDELICFNSVGNVLWRRRVPVTGYSNVRQVLAPPVDRQIDVVGLGFDFEKKKPAVFLFSYRNSWLIQKKMWILDGKEINLEIKDLFTGEILDIVSRFHTSTVINLGR